MYKYINIYSHKHIYKKMVKSQKRVIVEIDINLHKEFKKTCAIYDDSMSMILKKAIVQYLADHKKNIIY